MKINITLIFIALLTCCKRDVEVQQSHCTPDNFIVAGVNSKCMVYRDFNPDIDIPIYPIGEGKNFDLDINNDHFNDMEFGMFTVSGPNATIYIGTENILSNKVCFNTKNLSYQIHPSDANPEDSVAVNTGKIIQYIINDTITKSWSTVSSTYSYNGKSYPLLGGSYSLVNNEYDPLIKNKYIAFGYVQNTDTLFGWLQFSVINTHLIIHDCAYQQKY